MHPLSSFYYRGQLFYSHPSGLLYELNFLFSIPVFHQYSCSSEHQSPTIHSVLSQKNRGISCNKGSSNLFDYWIGSDFCLNSRCKVQIHHPKENKMFLTLANGTPIKVPGNWNELPSDLKLRLRQAEGREMQLMTTEDLASVSMTKLADGQTVPIPSLSHLSNFDSKIVSGLIVGLEALLQSTTLAHVQVLKDKGSPRITMDLMWSRVDLFFSRPEAGDNGEKLIFRKPVRILDLNPNESLPQDSNVHYWGPYQHLVFLSGRRGYGEVFQFASKSLERILK